MIGLVIRGKLKLLTNLHIGSGISNDYTDLPVIRDSEGMVFIPGTSIAGALRSGLEKLQEMIDIDHIEEPLCDCPACTLFGSFPSTEYERDLSPTLTASKIWVYDSYVSSAASKDRSISSIRDHVGISRVNSTAAYHAKYNEESVVAGTEFDFCIAIESDAEHLHMLAAVLNEWKSGRGALGGGRSKGFGRVKLDNIKVFKINLSSIDKVIAYLQCDDILTAVSSLFLSEEPNWLQDELDRSKDCFATDKSRRVYTEIDLKLTVDGGVVVSDIVSEVIEDTDIAPIKQCDKYIIPGSSLRGAFRAQAERVARTVVTMDTTDRGDYLKKCPACHPFNLPSSKKGSCESGYRVKIEEGQIVDIKSEVCLACRFFGMTHLGSRISISDGIVEKHLEPDRFNFVAIDRFTGGSLDKALFNAKVLMYPKFKTKIIIENPADWELGWLYLVIRDIQDGFVSIGWGKSKWFGRLGLESINVRELWTIEKSVQEKTDVEGVFVIKNRFSSFDNLWKEAAKSYCSEFLKTLSAHEWGLQNGEDSYFKEVNDTLSLSDIYPREGLQK